MKREQDFEQIYREHQHSILVYVTKLVGPDAAEDLTQDIFEKVNRRLDTFRGESSLATWLYRIATNAALDKLKSSALKIDDLRNVDDLAEEGHTQQAPTGTAPLSPEHLIVRKDMNQCIREFIGRLPPEYRIVLALSEIKGLRNREIAEILEVSIETVKIRLHRARARLKKEFEEGCDFYRDERNVFSCDRKASKAIPETSD